MELEAKFKKEYIEKVKQLKEDGISQYSIQMLLSLYDASEQLPDSVNYQENMELDYDYQIRDSIMEFMPVLRDNSYETKGLDKLFKYALDEHSKRNYIESLTSIYKLRAAMGRPLNPKFHIVIMDAFSEVYSQVMANEFKDLIIHNVPNTYINTRK